jgi:hypothetical protein
MLMNCRIKNVKLSLLPKAIYRCNAMPIKSPNIILAKIEKSILKFVWKHKRTRTTEVILNEKSNTGDIRI